jgi:hypothetical protein
VEFGEAGWVAILHFVLSNVALLQLGVAIDGAVVFWKRTRDFSCRDEVACGVLVSFVCFASPCPPLGFQVEIELP